MMDAEKNISTLIGRPVVSTTELEAPKPHLDINLNIETLIRALRNAAERSSSTSLFVKEMKECLRILDGCYNSNYNDNHFHMALCNSKSFNDSLHSIIQRSVVSEFTNRDYFAYDGSDFEGHDQISDCVLIFCTKLLSGFRSSNEMDAELARESGQEETLEDVDMEKFSSSTSVTCQKLTNHLPHILLMISGHANHQFWSSQECQKHSLHLIQVILQLFSCTSVADLLSLRLDPKSVLYLNIKNVSFQHSDRSLLTCLLYYFEEPLSKDRWEKNPFLCESFSWLIKQLKPSQLSECINQILAVSLNFLHNFDSATKLKGVQLLQHLIHSTSNEELRWYNRAEVIYEALKVHIYSREAKVLDAIIGCIFSVLKILEKSKIPERRYHFVLSTLLSNAESENILALRRIYMSNLAKFFLDCEIVCIGHLSNILRVIENYLEVEDGPEETARLSALDALHNVILVSWPRVMLHSETIIRFLLKFVININSSSFLKMTGPSFKTRAEDKVIICLNLLNNINPNVKTCLEAIQKSDHQGYLTSLLEAWSLIHSS